MDKRFLGILAAIIIIFIGVFAVSQHSSNKSTNGGSSSSSAQPTNHVEGQGKSGVTLVEYGDYECPYCAGYSDPVNQVINKYKSQITFQFRNLPLTSIHQNARAGARAAEAAGLQGKYWQMHDLLYQQGVAYYVNNDGNTWVNASDPLPKFDGYARQIGLNVTKFDQDYASDAVNNAINADLTAFGKTGAEQSTPTFFLDGKNISNQPLGIPVSGGSPYQYDLQQTLANFSKLIDAAIAQKAKA